MYNLQAGVKLNQYRLTNNIQVIKDGLTYQHTFAIPLNQILKKCKAGDI